MAKGEDLSLECGSGPEESAERADQGRQGRGIIDRKLTYGAENIKDLCARKAWKRRRTYGSVSLKRLSGPAGNARPGKVGHHPVASLAWSGGDPGCEA